NRPPLPITLASGENRAGVNFRMAAAGVISGVIFDETGDPLPEAQVQVFTPGFQRRKRTLFPGPSAMTDSDGRYRVSNVMPGQHMVMASKQNPSVKGQAEVTAGQPQPVQIYGVQYYPGTPNGESAAPINVEPGKEVSQINLRLPGGPPSGPVQGTVVVPAGVNPAGPVMLTLSSLSGMGRFTRGSQAFPPDLVFQFDGLQQDKYLLSANGTFNGKQYRGTQEIDLRGQTPSGLTITLEPGIDLSGKVKLEGPDAAKYSITFVSLTPGDAAIQSGRPPRAQVAKDGSF